MYCEMERNMEVTSGQFFRVQGSRLFLDRHPANAEFSLGILLYQNKISTT